MKIEQNETGGYLIPKSILIYTDRPGRFFACVRWFGERILRLGAWVRALGYMQKEIHPYQAIVDALNTAKVKQ